MSEQEIYEVVSRFFDQVPVVCLLAWLFADERASRKAAEKRERDILREVAELSEVE